MTYERSMDMTVYHGSNTPDIKILKPNLADHDRPYVYTSSLEPVAAFYLCNAVERPYYWFPYGFEKGDNVPVYHELYRNALREVSDGVSGCIYEVEAQEGQVIPFKNIPFSWLATEPVPVKGCRRVDNTYSLFMEFERSGKMRVSRFEEKTAAELDRWYEMILNYITEKNMRDTPGCSYAVLIREKFPWVWERYIREK